jgi:hypothetical protein
MYVYVKNCCFHCICEAHPRRVAAGARVRLPGCRVVEQDLTSRAGWLVRNAVRCRGLLPMAELVSIWPSEWPSRWLARYATRVSAGRSAATRCMKLRVASGNRSTRTYVVSMPPLCPVHAYSNLQTKTLITI